MATLLEQSDLPAAFRFSEEFGISDDLGRGMATRIFSTSDLESEDPGTIVISIAVALGPEELAEIDDLIGELERSYDEVEGSFGFDGFELLDASGLGNGGFGMRFELDFSAMFDALAEDFALDDADFEAEMEAEMALIAGIGMEAYFFFSDTQVLATMVMWTLERESSVDTLALAQIMDAKAAALQ